MATRRERSGRKVGSDEIAQQPAEPQLCEISQQGAAGNRREREQRQFDEGNRQHEALRCAHALHQRHRIDVTGRIAAGAHGDGDGGEQHRGQTRQIQEAARPIDGRVQLAAGFVDFPQALARRLGGDHVVAKLGHGRSGAREQRRIGGAAPGLNQLRRLDVRVVQQGGGRQVDESGALIGPIVEHFSEPERGRADAQLRPQGDLELRDDPRVDPHFTAAGNLVGDVSDAERRIGDPHVSAQGILRRDGIECGQLAHVAVEDRGRKRQHLRALQPELAALRKIARGDGIGRLEAQIGRQNLGGLRAYSLRDAAGEETDGGQATEPPRTARAAEPKARPTSGRARGYAMRSVRPAC